MKWIRQWAERRRLSQRALFRFHDGTCDRYADPAMVWRGLLTHPDMIDLKEMMVQAEMGSEPETSIVLKALSEIFDVPRWTESSRFGLTDWELLDLVRQFDEYLEALKKNTSLSRMPWQLSAYAQQNGTVQETPEAPTNSTADSYSTPAESNTVEATASSEPSPTE